MCVGAVVVREKTEHRSVRGARDVQGAGVGCWAAECGWLGGWLAGVWVCRALASRKTNRKFSSAFMTPSEGKEMSRIFFSSVLAIAFASMVLPAPWPRGTHPAGQGQSTASLDWEHKLTGHV